MPLTIYCSSKSRLVLPSWFYLVGTGSLGGPRQSPESHKTVVEDFTGQYVMSPFLSFLPTGPTCWKNVKSFKLEYHSTLQTPLENLLSEFCKIFQDCCPHPGGPGNVDISPAPQLWEGLGCPKFGGYPPKSPTYGFRGSRFFASVSSAR